ncbi:MAG: hypothetical protein ACO1RT_01630, partial [Planctomycetaceae bacterium]
MSRFALAALLPVMAFFGGIAAAQPLDWNERYALSADRASLLSELIPGTEDYYFYHCLNYQVSGELDKAEAMLAQWKADERARQSGHLQGVEERQHLLTYHRTPDRTIEFLRKRLNIVLHHDAPAVAGQQLYPSTLDPALLDARQLIDAVHLDELTRAGLRLLGSRVLSGEVTL